MVKLYCEKIALKICKTFEVHLKNFDSEVANIHQYSFFMEGTDFWSAADQILSIAMLIYRVFKKTEHVKMLK